MRLSDIARKSKIPLINLKVNGELISFNIYQESKINEDNLNSELKKQPSLYSYLTTLNNELTQICEDQEVEVERIYSKRLLFYKIEENFYSKKHGKVSDKMAEVLVNQDEIYIAAKIKLNRLKKDKFNVYSAVRAFEQKKDILQTLSANVRKEQH